MLTLCERPLGDLSERSRELHILEVCLVKREDAYFLQGLRKRDVLQVLTLAKGVFLDSFQLVWKDD